MALYQHGDKTGGAVCPGFLAILATVGGAVCPSFLSTSSSIHFSSTTHFEK